MKYKWKGLNYPIFSKNYPRWLEDAHRYAKVAGVNFFKQNFSQAGDFLDTSLTPWAKRSLTVGSDRGVLIQSGKLRDSIHAVNRGIDRIIYQTDPLAYAKIHNEGGYIVVTERMKRYFWYLYMKSTGTMQRKRMANYGKIKPMHGCLQWLPSTKVWH